MRNTERIEAFMEKLEFMWKQYVPAWRFGQLMSNFFDFVLGETQRDIFFIEDDAMEELMIKYFKQYGYSDEVDVDK